MSSKIKNSTIKKKNNKHDDFENSNMQNDKQENIIKQNYKFTEKEIEQNNLHIPFEKTTLSSPIMITPDQMDNKMYIHIKSNLKNKLENMCYENYGYIDKIYNIEEISDGVIEPEDPTCSAKIDIKFTCKLYLPIIGKEIVCKIDRMNKALIMGINGPIKVIITVDKINKDNFFSDINRNIRIKNTSEIVVPGMYLKVLVLSKSFSNYDKNIIVIGFLQNIATQQEVNKYMDNNDDTNLVLNETNDFS